MDLTSILTIKRSIKIFSSNNYLDPDLHFEAALYAKAVVRKKVVSDSLSLPEPLTCAGVVTSEQTEMKDDTADEDNLLEAPEKTKPPMSPQKRRASKRRSKASSSEVNTKKTKIASTHKTETAMEKVQPAKDKKTEQTPPENASDSEETAGTQDMESPSSSNT